jgi:restriction endonuclease S subunit
MERTRFRCPLNCVLAAGGAAGARRLIKKQTGQANVNGTSLKNMLIPLPALAKQHRIVAKVEEMMALCDKLEASLATGDSTRTRLLDSLLAEALAPGNENLPTEEIRLAAHG